MQRFRKAFDAFFASLSYRASLVRVTSAAENLEKPRPLRSPLSLFLCVRVVILRFIFVLSLINVSTLHSSISMRRIDSIRFSSVLNHGGNAKSTLVRQSAFGGESVISSSRGLRSVELCVQAATVFERLMISVQTLINGNLPEANGDASPLSSSQQSRDFRPVDMPKTKIGLASTDGELVVLFKKYLEIVGLVFFVWLLGKCVEQRK